MGFCGEDLLDGIEVRAVGWQEAHRRTRGFDGFPNAGANRPLHPNPTARRDMMAAACQHCGADVSGVPQIVCEAYEAIEIPEIKPDITRVTLSGGTCPCCAKRFKAAPPQGLKRARKLHPENWGLSIH